MEIAPGIFQVKVPIPDNPLEFLNCYLVRDKDGWLMVDTGWYTPDAFDSLEKGLQQLGIVLEDISTVILTHVHPDHYGLAGRIKQRSPRAQLMTHCWELHLIESRYVKFVELHNRMSLMLERHGVPRSDLMALNSLSMQSLRFIKVTFPDRVLYGGEIVSAGNYELEVIWTPGHSPGHVCLYEPQNRLLFSGDHILQEISPHISYHVESGDDPLDEYVCSLRKLQHLQVNKVLPAHKGIFSDLQGRIVQIIEHHDKRKEEILESTSGAPISAYQVSSGMTWDFRGKIWEDWPPLQKHFAVTETIAHLECLRREGKINKITEDNRLFYRAV